MVRVDPVRLLYLLRQHWFKSGSNLVQNLVQNWFKPDVWSTNQSQIVVHHVVWSIKVDVKRRKIQIVEISLTMTNADNTFYHFSDEEDGEDAILARAFERWEQIGGGAASDPLFHFKMQPTGRRRCWRNVLERVQFNAQLRQLPSLLTGSPTPTKRRISKRGCSVQQRQGQELHRQAVVTEGPCGLEELRQL